MKFNLPDIKLSLNDFSLNGKVNEVIFKSFSVKKILLFFPYKGNQVAEFANPEYQKIVFQENGLCIYMEEINLFDLEKSYFYYNAENNLKQTKHFLFNSETPSYSYLYEYKNNVLLARCRLDKLEKQTSKETYNLTNNSIDVIEKDFERDSTNRKLYEFDYNNCLKFIKEYFTYKKPIQNITDNSNGEIHFYHEYEIPNLSTNNDEIKIEENNNKEDEEVENLIEGKEYFSEYIENFYDENKFLIETHFCTIENEIKEKIKYENDLYGNPILEITINEIDEIIGLNKYSYKYDKNKNWLKCNVYSVNENTIQQKSFKWNLEYIRERKIKYFQKQ